MLRLLKALPIALAVALSVFTTSCGSGGSAQVRVVNAIPDNGANGSIPLDIWFNDNLIITALGVNSVDPQPSTPAKYLNVPSGNVTIVGYDTGTKSTPVVSNNTDSGLNSSTQYTLLLGGFAVNPPQIYVIPDNNTPPPANNVFLRIINGSASEGANALSVYVYPVGQLPPATPQFSGLTLGMSSSYTPLSFTTGQPAYVIEVTRANGTPILFTHTLPGFSAGEIMTVVLDDLPGGAFINTTNPIVMIDLN
ncbi:MAG TPA: DUF4397 domain-containing protein [Terriglobales bacterium]|jgi:hypothetical protein|nr:DUF4397 domain-containing protein [Terriglobales bacterium]